jgi:hypothetical protein
MAEGRMRCKQFIDGQAAIVSQGIQYRRAGPGVDLLAGREAQVQAVEQAWRLTGPVIHLQRETQQGEGIANHGRVEQVAPDTAEGLLAERSNSGCGHR